MSRVRKVETSRFGTGLVFVQYQLGKYCSQIKQTSSFVRKQANIGGLLVVADHLKWSKHNGTEESAISQHEQLKKPGITQGYTISPVFISGCTGV